MEEIYDPPAFVPGDRVRSVRAVRNDGTVRDAAMGEVLVAEGEDGYVRSVGTYLNRFYVYGVDFVARGRIVGMRTHEIAAMED
ncbi:MAG: nitrogen fixation protein NifZ [Magnetospirillum sp.]|nr:nitrogen fixation protein NifZ [Magnetospirillum sp.]